MTATNERDSGIYDMIKGLLETHTKNIDDKLSSMQTHIDTKIDGVKDVLTQRITNTEIKIENYSKDHDDLNTLKQQVDKATTDVNRCFQKVSTVDNKILTPLAIEKIAQSTIKTTVTNVWGIVKTIFLIMGVLGLLGGGGTAIYKGNQSKEVITND